ncbi:MAG: alpha/beta hydrolase family protein [Fimbriimonadaceae bacterium]
MELARRRYLAMDREFAWTRRGDADPVHWGDALRARLVDLLGIEAQPERRDFALGEPVRCDGFDRIPASFDSPIDGAGFGYLLVPHGHAGRAPAILCLPGHGIGVDGVVGLRDDGYSTAFAVRCVRRGYVVFALEQMSFGHRCSRETPDGGSTCFRDSTAALLLGECMVGWRVRDARIALTFLSERVEVDADRLAVMGISGGGTTAFFTSCVDTRVAAAMISGYFNTFADSILGVDHCVDNYVPGLGTVAEMPDLVAAIAPRALITESGTEDPIFPLPAYRGACAWAESIYDAHRARSRFHATVFEGGHVFHGEETLPVLDGYLAP